MYNFQRERSFQVEENRRQKSPLSPVKKGKGKKEEPCFSFFGVEIIKK